MGDSWSDDEFIVPTITVKNNWDDEENDDVELEENTVAKPSASQVAAKKKKEEKANILFETKLKLSQYENETPEEKSLRERRQAEETDVQVAAELFANTKAKTTSTNGIGATQLKTISDHSNFGYAIATKLKTSSSYNIGAFYKNLNKLLESKDVSAEIVEEIHSTITQIRDQKVKDKAPPVVEKKSKKEIAKEKQRQNEVFGGYDEDYDDTYDKLQDQYMF
jgi:signal recognition particle GTPase